MTNNTPPLIESEYQQTWEDFRHRATMSGTWFSLYIAITGGLFYIISSLLDKISSITFINGYQLLTFVGFVGLLYSIGTIGLLFGERRAWSADIECISRIEKLTLSEKPLKLIGRMKNFDDFLQKKKFCDRYRLSFTSAFLWTIIIIFITGISWGLIFIWALVKYIN